MKKRFRRLLRLRNKSGFTLVEVIISCALLGILVLGVMGFVTPVLASVREKEKNARAYMLSDAINTYIYQTTQYAYYVATFTGAASKDTATGVDETISKLTYSGTEFPKRSGEGLATLKARFDKLGSDKYEIRCIGIRWRTDQLTGEKKLMITNEQVDQEKLTLTPAKSKPVFEDCFYSGLYPVISFENYSNQYQLNKGGTLVDQVDADKVNIAPGLGLTVDVYTSLDCYNIDSTTRAKAISTMKGESYIGFTNIRSTVTNNDGSLKIVPNIEVNSYGDAYDKDKSAVYSADGSDYYYPDSFIYYIAHKTVQG